MTAAAGVKAATLLAEPHHDGSDAYVVQAPEKPGDEAVVDEETAEETWWLARWRVWNPTTRYRWLLSGGEIGHAWLNGLGLSAH